MMKFRCHEFLFLVQSSPVFPSRLKIFSFHLANTQKCWHQFNHVIPFKTENTVSWMKII